MQDSSNTSKELSFFFFYFIDRFLQCTLTQNRITLCATSISVKMERKSLFEIFVYLSNSFHLKVFIYNCHGINYLKSSLSIDTSREKENSEENQ